MASRLKLVRERIRRFKSGIRVAEHPCQVDKCFDTFRTVHFKKIGERKWRVEKTTCYMNGHKQNRKGGILAWKDETKKMLKALNTGALTQLGGF